MAKMMQSALSKRCHLLAAAACSWPLDHAAYSGCGCFCRRISKRCPWKTQKIQKKVGVIEVVQKAITRPPVIALLGAEILRLILLVISQCLADGVQSIAAKCVQQTYPNLKAPSALHNNALYCNVMRAYHICLPYNSFFSEPQRSPDQITAAPSNESGSSPKPITTKACNCIQTLGSSSDAAEFTMLNRDLISFELLDCMQKCCCSHKSACQKSIRSLDH